MFNLITLMVSKKSKTSSKESQNKKFSFNFFSIFFSSKKIRALALVTILGMSVIVTSGCKQDPPITQDSEETNPDNPTQEPTDEDPTVEDPTIETPTVDIANTPIVKAIKEMGFGIDVVEVAPVEGLYTPEPGDLIDLKFEDHDVNWDIHMQLDRENSTKDNLVYKWVSCWNMMYDEDVPVEKRDNYICKMTVDKENYSVTFSYYYNNKECHTMTCRIALDENNKPSFIYNGYVNGHIDTVQGLQDGIVFKPPGISQFSNIEIQLAK